MGKSKKLQLTPEGLEQLQNELKERIEVTRKNLQDQLDAVLKEGDISENTSYYKIQDEIGANDKRIEEIQKILLTASIVKNTNGSNGGNISIGSVVTLKVEEKDVTYEVVGSTEADPSKNRISVDSPFGKALFGKKSGEDAVVTTPVGEKTFRIVSVS